MAGPERLMKWLGLLFGAIGIGLVALGVWSLAETQRFLTGAQRAEGVVTRMEWSTRGTAYAFVQFHDGDRPVEIRSRTGSSPPAFSVGQKVTVLYQPGAAEQGVIENFWEQYLLAALSGLLGTVFAAVGGGFLLVPALARRRRRLALTMGTPVQAKVIEVRLRRSTSSNGRHPWVIVAEYQDESLNRKLAFTSLSLWVNPEAQYQVGSAVTVYYLPDKPWIYAFELERLPEPV